MFLFYNFTFQRIWPFSKLIYKKEYLSHLSL
jgi:hypothetical protein